MAFTLTPAAPFDGEAIVPLDLAREYLRRLDQDEDQTIQTLRDAAIRWVEKHTAHALTVRSFVWVTDRPSACLSPSIAPIRAITKVEVAGADRVWVEAAAGTWAADAVGVVRLAANLSRSSAVRITLDAGFDDPSVEASSFVSAVLALLAHLFTNRGNSDAGEVPSIVKLLCSVDRTPVIA